ncbi:uncharacterized protein EI90DRAFT_3287209 [Cantharellus anzutake]|uniref:uncharacterized protein n=1 Tax=Cantharellus anzutake TaxID=1750568 RepID=UPI00190384BA|nr:uncharacterized protein EI90DRAFT_3287209 [Cantharellus anzutake]KAF8336834.1 hypothetical protein EI90DRAFT_3287209 [Cantharellus anzutake]
MSGDTLKQARPAGLGIPLTEDRMKPELGTVSIAQARMPRTLPFDLSSVASNQDAGRMRKVPKDEVVQKDPSSIDASEFPDIYSNHSDVQRRRKSIPSSFLFFSRRSSDQPSAARPNSLQKRNSAPASITLVNPYSPPQEIYPSQSGLSVTEKPHNRTKIGLDLVLDGDLVVEGGQLCGSLKIKVPFSEKKNGSLLSAGVRLRVVGIESAGRNQHPFMQHSRFLHEISPSIGSLYCSDADREGFRALRAGLHKIQFNFPIPIGSGAKGVLEEGSSSSSVHYIIAVSMKVLPSRQQSPCVVHFHRMCQIYPILDPNLLLRPSPTPISGTAEGSLVFGTGTLKVTGILERLAWIAGQVCWVYVLIENNTTKRVKNLTLSLIRHLTVFKVFSDSLTQSSGQVGSDVCETNHRQVAEAILEVGQRGCKGQASAKGWWLGVDPGGRASPRHGIMIPSNALSVPRSRLIEVQYFIRVEVSAGRFSDVKVDLPITIVNLVSLYPPRELVLHSPSSKVPRPPAQRSKPDVSMLRPPVAPVSVPVGPGQRSTTPPLLHDTKDTPYRKNSVLPKGIPRQAPFPSSLLPPSLAIEQSRPLNLRPDPHFRPASYRKKTADDSMGYSQAVESQSTSPPYVSSPMGPSGEATSSASKLWQSIIRSSEFKDIVGSRQNTSSTADKKLYASFGISVDCDGNTSGSEDDLNRLMVATLSEVLSPDDIHSEPLHPSRTRHPAENTKPEPGADVLSLASPCNLSAAEDKNQCADTHMDRILRPNPVQDMLNSDSMESVRSAPDSEPKLRASNPSLPQEGKLSVFDSFSKLHLSSSAVPPNAATVISPNSGADSVIASKTRSTPGPSPMPLNSVKARVAMLEQKSRNERLEVPAWRSKALNR